MPLMELELPEGDGEVPGDVRTFLREAERRIERFRETHHVPGFVPSDFEQAYHVLRGLSQAGLTPGKLFCEWGSGFGVVTCLAALLDYDACGIEIEPDLVDAARRLAEDFEVPVEFLCDSFLPSDDCAGSLDGCFSWLATEGSRSLDELGLAPDDFDVIFAYPWPDEHRTIGSVFERFAATGAVLLTYHGDDVFQLRRKTRAIPARHPKRSRRVP